MPEYRTIAVDPETYELIARLANLNGRTIGKQVAAMSKFLITRTRVIRVEELPHPVDAEHVLMVIVAPSEIVSSEESKP